MLALLEGLFVNKYTVYIVGALLGIGVLTGGYFIWRAQITSAAQLQFDNAQLKQTIADQTKYINEMKAINDAQAQSVKDLMNFNSSLNASTLDLDTYLNSSDATKDDRPSSLVLKNTITKLKALK